ncbi:MAG: glycosyl transferase family 2 [uncultured bacterium]|nr:MAG: glycosyl transferase family 2 [uncultured bacterium]
MINSNLPIISIVMATYNRSNIISYAIESVLSQTITNWELIIVGDGCTDETEQVINTFQDQRIIFYNLPTNHGEQSVPNNFGMKKATGKYLAFLGHDDMWFPHHLENALATLNEDTDVKMVCCPTIFIPNNGKIKVLGFFKNSLLPAREYMPTSSWVMLTDFARAVGDWKSAWTLKMTPQDQWLKRAISMTRITVTNKIGLVKITSADRKNSYSCSSNIEHEYYKTIMLEDIKFCEKSIINHFSCKETHYRLSRYALAEATYFQLFRAVLLKSIKLILTLFRIDQDQLFLIRKNVRKGAVINGFRKTRGLKEIINPSKSADVI